MTDKLPEWLESWLDENSIHPFAGSSFRAVSTYDLRAFLAQFVLCERDVVAHAVVAPDGNIRMWHRSQFEATPPLHAPAKGLTDNVYMDNGMTGRTPLYKAAGGGR